MKSKNVVQFTGDLEDAAYRKLTKQELVRIIKKKGWDTDENQLLKKEKEILIHLAKTLHLQKQLGKKLNVDYFDCHTDYLGDFLDLSCMLDSFKIKREENIFIFSGF